MVLSQLTVAVEKKLHFQIWPSGVIYYDYLCRSPIRGIFHAEDVKQVGRPTFVLAFLQTLAGVKEQLALQENVDEVVAQNTDDFHLRTVEDASSEFHSSLQK